MQLFETQNWPFLQPIHPNSKAYGGQSRGLQRAEMAAAAAAVGKADPEMVGRADPDQVVERVEVVRKLGR